MRWNTILQLASLTIFLWTCAGAQTPGSEIPIAWTIHSGYSVDPATGAIQPCEPNAPGCMPVRIRGNGTGTYTRHCRIRINHNSDAECTASNGRYFLLDFTNPLAINQDPGLTLPDWVTGTIQAPKLVVRNLLDALHHSRSDSTEYSFTTSLNALAMQTAPEDANIHYHVSMSPDDPGPNAPNDPYQTAEVHVHHCPDTSDWAVPTAWCATGQKETWWVYPAQQDPAATPGPTHFLIPLAPPGYVHQVAGLSMRNNRTGVTTPIAQYSLPFLFSIRVRTQITCATDGPQVDGPGRETRCDADNNHGLYEP